MLEKPTQSKERVLVLGFYDRKNTGDDQYKLTIPAFFSHRYHFDFVSIDDAVGHADARMQDYAFVICGGGDIINPYFMPKIKRVIARYAGPTYAISVGIPYDADVHFLDAFDHVVVRGKRDLLLANKFIGSKNVSYMPDVGFMLPAPHPQQPPQQPQQPPFAIHVGICLAKPVLTAHGDFAAALAGALCAFARGVGDGAAVAFHFFMFNYNSGNPVECDVIASRQIQALMTSEDGDVAVILHDDIMDDVPRMQQELSRMSLVIGMRYHSMVFSLALRVPLIACVSTKKAAQLVEDIGMDPAFVVRMDEKKNDASMLTETMMNRLHASGAVPEPPSERVFAKARAELASTTSQSRFRRLLCTSSCEVPKLICADECALDRCLRLLSTYHGSEFIDANSIWREKRLDLHGHDPVEVARIVCFGVTGDFDNACVWGLAGNMLRSTFVMGDAVHYIQEHYVNVTRAMLNQRGGASEERYLPTLRTSHRTMLGIDPFIHASSRTKASSVHRSGWSYVTGHLENMDASRFGKEAELIVDSYVDRTFHWGHDSLRLAGLIPYRSAWVGFIHHTFDTTHSAYNNRALFRNATFLDSLPVCKCLIVLSDYLARQVRAALIDVGCVDVPVRVVTHPTEFVRMGKMFTLTRFLKNADRKIIQVGAWLRNSYSIFALPDALALLKPEGGTYAKVTKAALKGNNMDGYYVSDDDFDGVLRAMKAAFPHAAAQTSYTCVDTDVDSGTARNKYMAGLERVIETNHQSVRILTKHDNAAYDDLLSENIVFLDLVDCSAANTIMECVVRNTILIVNRHPAVEEVLGASYPGFYSNLLEAVEIIEDIAKLRACYIHLARLNKDRLRIETFLRDFTDIVREIRG
jgi:hypothetical protein